MLFIHELFFYLQTQSIRKQSGDGKTLYYTIISKNQLWTNQVHHNETSLQTTKKFKVIRTEF